MRYLTLDQVVDLHRRIIAKSGGSPGLRDPESLDSAVAQPMMTFDGKDLYPTLAAKAGALAHSIIQNHPFVDGNKRVGHASMEVFLVMNGVAINAAVDEQEAIILAVAGGKSSRAELINWIERTLVPYSR